MKQRISVQFEKLDELNHLKKQLVKKYPSEKVRHLYARAFIAGMKQLIGE